MLALLTPLGPAASSDSNWPRAVGPPLGPATRNASTTGAIPSIYSELDFERIGSLRLRHHLIESPAPEQPANGSAQAPVASAPAPQPLALLGTIGDSLAMLQTPGGPVELKGVGESIAGMTILSISPARVEARYNGRVVVLVKPTDATSSNSSFIRDSGDKRGQQAGGSTDAQPTARMR